MYIFILLFETVPFCVVLFPLVIWIYSRITIGRCDCKTNMAGKTVLITGGNIGIGFETARDLARRNARVIIACKDEPNEQETRKIKQGMGKDVILMKLDLSSIASIKEFVQKFLILESRLDVLINNAGRRGGRRRALTEDGFEVTLATNHLGPFLLTHLLLDILKKSSPSRIIVLSSAMHWLADLNLNDFQMQKNYTSTKAYNVTKLLNIYFTKMLAEELMESGVTVNCVHPGLARTNIFTDKSGTFIGFLTTKIIVPLYGRSPEEAAQSVIHLAVAKELERVTGKYFAECREQSPSKAASDLVAMKKSWEISKALLNSYLSDATTAN